MSHDSDIERFTKPLKRVRFAEEVQEHFYHDEHENPIFETESELRNSYELSTSVLLDENNISNQVEMSTLNEIVTATKLMRLSMLEVAVDTAPCKSDFKESEPEAPDSVDQSYSMAQLSHKRSSEGNHILRQTSKLNTCLKNSGEINSAIDLKKAVYNAWSKLKTAENKENKCIPVANDQNVNTSEDAFNDAFQKWKEAKRKMKKNPVQTEYTPKIEDDFNEKKMAFQAWKTKKDDFLRQQIAEKSRKEEKERLESLMNERVRKNNAESAYLAWMSHKTVVIKKEQKKNKWLSEIEKVKHEEKIKRREAAAKIYYQWLKMKVYTIKKCPYKNSVNKPPWTPAGKASSLI